MRRLKGEKREGVREKQKHAPTGGGFAAAAKRSRVARGYAGLPRVLKPSVHIRMPKRKNP